MQNKNLFIYSGFIWCLVFACMSFYWASGGMIGVKSLGGVIYQKAIARDAAFLSIVWLTGFIKLGGGFFLLLLLKKRSKVPKRILYSLSVAGGIFLFLYGLANFVTLILTSMGWLHLTIDSFALTWRLLFWEPFWMVGGMLFILSGIAFKKSHANYDISH